MADPFPQVTVEVAFEPATATPPTYTDVSAKHAEDADTSFKLGRQYETDVVEPGTGSLVLNNDGGEFTPGRVGSPYYPYVKPQRRVRLRATVPATSPVGAGTVVDLATARATSWGAAWPGGVGLTSRTQLALVDGLARLKRRMLDSVYREEVLSDGPIAYYPLGEAQGAQSVSSVALTPQPAAPLRYAKWPFAIAATGTAAFGSTGIVPADPSSALTLAPVSRDAGPAGQTGWDAGYFLRIAANGVGPLVPSHGPYTIECVASLNPVPASVTNNWYQVLWAQANASGNITAALYAVSTTIIFYADIASGTYTQTDIAYNFADGKPHHFAATFDGFTPRVVVDGQYVGRNSPAGAFPDRTGRHAQVGAWAPLLQQPYLLSGTVSHVAIYPTVLTPARIATHYQAFAGFPGETADARLARILGYARWPAADRLLDPGISPLGLHLTSGTDALAALQGTAADDGGYVYPDPSGRAVFHNRQHRLNQTPKWTLNVTLQDVNADIDFTVDDARIANIVTASTGTGMSTVRVTDETSRADYGDLTRPLTLNLQAPGDLTDAANWTLGHASAPQPRSSTLTIDPLTNPALWDCALHSTLGDVLQLTNLPAQAPAASMLFAVESKTWSYQRGGGGGHWTVAFEISPYGAPDAKVATFTGGPGDPLPAGVTDPHTWDAFADFDGTDTFAW